MITPINRSNFLYNLFHTNSDTLSANEKKKFKNIQRVIGASTFGMGLAVLGIAYLIQSSCCKASKTNKVAQNQLNAGNNSQVDVQTNTHIPQSFDIFPYMKDKIIDCIETFAKELPLNKLKSVIFQRTEDSDPYWPEIIIPVSLSNKNDLVEYIRQNCVGRPSFYLNPSSNELTTFNVILSGSDENGNQIKTRAILNFKNGKYVGGTTGSGIEKINKNYNTNNLSFYQE